jgi:hypothetical protein
VPNLGMVEIVVSARAKKSAAEPEPGREQLDELIAKVERGYSKRDSES